MKPKLTVALLACLATATFSHARRQQLDLTNTPWRLWLDTAAQWQNDKLYLPPVQVQALPENLPTGGWDKLQSADGKTVSLPATVEEYFWGQAGNPFGVSGNYLGVSWFSTRVKVPKSYKGQQLSLHFESVRFRAEIYVNRKLVGYDLVNSTPFDVDVSASLIPGATNEIAVRITDPNGNFDWRDSQNFMWGDYRTQPTHGFGGITGSVTLVATDPVHLSDIFVKNTPQPAQVAIAVSARNPTGSAAAGYYRLEVKEAKSGRKVLSRDYPAVLPAGDTTQSFSITVPNPLLWDVDHPNLYVLDATWNGNNGHTDQLQQRFGLRWFEVKDVAGDRQFYLNGKRIVLRTAISWGFWPLNGIAPSNALARKQVMDAKALGLNMLNFHRTIGQQNVLDAADELGLLYFEEPGGNSYPDNLFEPKKAKEKVQTDFYMGFRTEKLNRMIRRDRSHPSLVIYNMHNERGAQPKALDSLEMQQGHALDNSRMMTYNSSNGSIKTNEPDPRFKLHLMPFDTLFRDYGWFDQHHAGGPGTYHDNLYNNPTHYAKYTDHKDEIVYYGEEGAIGTPPRLQLIRDEILKTGKDRGWETDAYLKWYDAYDRFLKDNGFQKAFPNVDSLTRKMGNVAFYYQGRVIENVRLNNIIDGYAINGWESMKLENHSGMVDNYRNLKGDADLIARYNTPLFVAVKLNHKVLPVGTETTADFFIVNEKNIQGAATLEVQAKDEKGHVYFSKAAPVTVHGGNEYGQLLLKGIKIPAGTAGYTEISAVLKQNNAAVCTGSDLIFAVKPDTTGITPQLLVADTSGAIGGYLTSQGVAYKAFTSGRPDGKVMVTGDFEPQQTGNPLVTDILEWVNNGNTLVIAGNIEKWAAYLAKKEVADYRGAVELGRSWYGGNYFAKESALFNGLPQGNVFNWEFQSLATYNKKRTGLRLFNGEVIVACVSDHKPEVYAALSIVKHGRGKIILCALDLLSCLTTVKEEKKAEGDGENASINTLNATASNPANVVGQQLLLNLLKN